MEYNKKFDFFKVTPKEAQITDFIEQNFKKFHGQMYHAEGAGFIWFAFDTETGMTEKQLSSDLNGEAEIEQVELS